MTLKGFFLTYYCVQGHRKQGWKFFERIRNCKNNSMETANEKYKNNSMENCK